LADKYLTLSIFCIAPSLSIPLLPQTAHSKAAKEMNPQKKLKELLRSRKNN